MTTPRKDIVKDYLPLGGWALAFVLCVLGIFFGWAFIIPGWALILTTFAVQQSIKGTIPRRWVDHRARDWWVKRRLPEGPLTSATKDAPWAAEYVDGFPNEEAAKDARLLYLRTGDLDRFLSGMEIAMQPPPPANPRERYGVPSRSANGVRYPPPRPAGINPFARSCFDRKGEQYELLAKLEKRREDQVKRLHSYACGTPEWQTAADQKAFLDTQIKAVKGILASYMVPPQITGSRHQGDDLRALREQFLERYTRAHSVPSSMILDGQKAGVYAHDCEEHGHVLTLGDSRCKVCKYEHRLGEHAADQHENCYLCENPNLP